MRKIVGFRINIRVHEILRRAKKKGLSLDSSGIKSEVLEQIALAAIKAAHPAVIFETFTSSDPDSPTLSSMPGLAYSLILATLGLGFEAARQSWNERAPEQSPWWEIIQDIGLDEIFRFTAGLITDEAGKESCEISPLNTITDAAALEKALSKIDAGKIGISLNGGKLAPDPSCAASLAWLAKSTPKHRNKLAA
ncbi:MAG: hypothetical protein ACYCPQ_07460 [Elusimicrobiota bacterium]